MALAAEGRLPKTAAWHWEMGSGESARGAQTVLGGQSWASQGVGNAEVPEDLEGGWLRAVCLRPRIMQEVCEKWREV